MAVFPVKPTCAFLIVSGSSLLFPLYAHAGGACDAKNGVSVIGVEYVATSCPLDANSAAYYESGIFTCSNKQVSYFNGSSYETTPKALIDAAGTGYRIFGNPAGSHFIFISKDYKGTLDLSVDGQLFSPPRPLPSGAGCDVVSVPTDLDGPGLDSCEQGGTTSNDTNPINPAWRGNKVQVETDYVGAGTFPLTFVRTYNSRATRIPRLFYQSPLRAAIGSRIPKSFIPVGTTPNPPVGQYVIGLEGEIANGQPQVLGFSDQYGVAGKWTHNYSMFAEVTLNGTQERVSFRRGDGEGLLFGKINGNWVPVVVNNEIMTQRPAIAERLAVTIGADSKVTEWRLTRSDDVTETYNAAGQLVKLTDRAGLTQTLTYTNGRLTRVSHANGAALQFEYDDTGRLKTLTLPDLNVISYAYNNYGVITRVTYPDATPTVSTDNPWRDYQYAKASMPLALTGMTDNGVQYANWDYDNQGRAIKSWHGAETDPARQANLAVVAYDATSADKAVITNASGTARTYNYLTRANRRVLGGIDQPAGAGCAAASQALTYGANGNVFTRTDFRGYITEYGYDATRNLETSRVEAKGTADERTILTEWHATFRLPIKITEEGRITEYDYDTRGNITLFKVTDTADSSTSRTTTFVNEYNADAAFPYLKKVTVDGPRSGVSDVTVYQFDSKGYLSSVSHNTAAGIALTTLYENYDANGRVKKITRPDGVVVELNYNARGQLISRKQGSNTATPLETVFEYYPATTLLSKVTQPDGSFVRYEYDTARRLTHVYDNAGNYIRYQLNRAGQAEVESVNDPAGVLAASMTRITQAQQMGQMPSPYKGQ